jgi:glutathione S-transferase
MILWQNRYSPFARKVLVLAHELGVRERITLKDTDPHADESLRGANPLCKIPTLILDDGRVLYDSRVICEYLLTHGDAARVAGPRDREAWEISRDHALGDGICDAAVALRGEKLRPAAQQSERYIGRQNAAILAACDALAAGVGQLGHRIDLGVIAIGCALGYLDLRHPHIDWRRHRAALAEWHAAFSARESMVVTSATARR